MASVRGNKDKTVKIVSYRWRACIGIDAITGKQQWSTKTVSSLGLTPAKELKEMQRQADEWEKALKEGTTPLKDDSFKGFIEQTFWPLHVLNGEHRPSTVAFYTNGSSLS